MESIQVQEGSNHQLDNKEMASNLEQEKQTSLEVNEFIKFEPSEETTDKSSIDKDYDYLTDNELIMDTQDSSDDIKQQESTLIEEEKLIPHDEKSKEDEDSDNCFKQEGQEDVVDDEIAIDEEDDGEASKDSDKTSEDNKSQANEKDNGANPDEPATLGRNRRVRQKNRYFLDFHCIDLTKGARSNRVDYDSFSITGTRSSNRRSTSDSNRGKLVSEPHLLTKKYCRKCFNKAPHSDDGECQVCLYESIVELTKRQQRSGQRGRGRQQHRDNNHQSTSAPAPATTSTKRKVTKQSGPKSSGQTNSTISSNSNTTNLNSRQPTKKYGIVIDMIEEDFLDEDPSKNQPAQDAISVKSENFDSVDGRNSTPSVDVAATIDAANPCTDNNLILVDNKLPKLDSWTPDEVADYILSKGFSQEAELFKVQSVDGISLLLMQRTDFTYGLKIKLGPALKIYDQICKLKKEYFRNVQATN